MTTDSDERLDRKTAEEQTRKPYAVPELSVHGTVEEITQQLAGAAGEQASRMPEKSSGARETKTEGQANAR